MEYDGPNYRIKICYNFNNSTEITYLELTWNKLSVAKENLKRIGAHYKMYRELKSYGYKLSISEIFKKNINQEWFVNKPELYCISKDSKIAEKTRNKLKDGDWEYRPDPYYAEYYLNLTTDDGDTMQIRPFWIGYFERLNTVEIEINNEDMKIEF